MNTPKGFEYIPIYEPDEKRMTDALRIAMEIRLSEDGEQADVEETGA